MREMQPVNYCIRQLPLNQDNSFADALEVGSCGGQTHLVRSNSLLLLPTSEGIVKKWQDWFLDAQKRLC